MSGSISPDITSAVPVAPKARFKKKNASGNEGSISTAAETNAPKDDSATGFAAAAAPKKKRGRPRKVFASPASAEAAVPVIPPPVPSTPSSVPAVPLSPVPAVLPSPIPAPVSPSLVPAAVSPSLVPAAVSPSPIPAAVLPSPIPTAVSPSLISAAMSSPISAAVSPSPIPGAVSPSLVLAVSSCSVPALALTPSSVPAPIKVEIGAGLVDLDMMKYVEKYSGTQMAAKNEDPPGIPSVEQEEPQISELMETDDSVCLPPFSVKNEPITSADDTAFVTTHKLVEGKVNVIPGFDFVTENDPVETPTESVAEVVSNLFAKPKGKIKAEKKAAAAKLSEDTAEEEDPNKIRRSSRIRTLETRRGGQRRREVVFQTSTSVDYGSTPSAQDDDSNSSSSNSNSGIGAQVSQSPSALQFFNISPSMSNPSCSGSPPGDGAGGVGTMAGCTSSATAMKLKSRWRNSLDAESFKISQPGETSFTSDLASLSLSENQQSEFKIELGLNISIPQSPLPLPQPVSNMVRRPGYIVYDKSDKELEEKLEKFQGIEENMFRTERKISKESKGILCDCYQLTKEEIARGEVGCGDDCINRLLFIECGPRCATGTKCTNKKFQRKEYCALDIFKTDKKGYGLRTTQALPQDGFVIEYVGEVLSPSEFDKRIKEYAKRNQEHFYFMSLKSDAIIDATMRGNCSRFINHSCEPNCETQKWTVNGELRIGFFARRDLEAGEEITFDYQFQRYGKEAQRCYCLASKCRGWIGGDGDSDKEEGDEEEEDELEEEEQQQEDAETETKVEKVRKPSRVRRPRRKETTLEDISFEEELSKLESTGLRNRMETLTLSRLMVRAENWADRERILNILISGDEPCRRLFLDYRGLRLIWGWMLSLPVPEEKLDSNEETAMKGERYHMLVLKALDVLPIPNKTILQDSKVLSIVEKWSSLPSATTVVIKKTKPEVSEATSSISLAEDEPPTPLFSPIEGIKEEDMKMDTSDTAALVIDEADQTTLIEHVWHFVDLSKDLLHSWSGLQEVFRIPKKERVEQLKEHEREADKVANTGAMENKPSGYDRDGRSKPWNKIERRVSSFSTDTYLRERETREHYSRNRDYSYNNHNHSVQSSTQPGMSKEQRRIEFAQRVAQAEEEEKNRRQQDEMVSLHQERCARLGLDMTTVPIVDPSCSYFLDPSTVTWKGIDLNDPTLPQEVRIIVQYTQNPPPEFLLQTTDLEQQQLPEPDLFPPWPAGLPPPPPLPPATLPRYWKMNVDDEGRCYYYDQRTRHTQWEPPSPEQSEPDSDSGDSDESDDESESQGVSTGTSENEATLSPGQEQEEQTQALMKFQSWINDRSEKRKKSGLVQERIISPRSEEEKSFINQKSIRAKKLQYMQEKMREAEALHLGLSPEEAYLAGVENLSVGTAGTSLERASDFDEVPVPDTAVGATPPPHHKPHRRVRERRRDKLAPGGQPAAPARSLSISSTSESPVPENEAPHLSDSLDSTSTGSAMTIPGLDEEVTGGVTGSMSDDRHESPSTTTLMSIVTSPPLAIPGPSRSARSNEKSSRSSTGADRKKEKAHRSKSAEKKSPAAAKQDGEKEKLQLQKKLKQTSMDCFRSQIANVIVQHLNPYRKPDCVTGRIQNTEDFKHLARKMTHTITLKELKRCQDGKTLVVSESVKHKTKEYVKKYMAKFPGNYIKSPEPDDMQL